MSSTEEKPAALSFGDEELSDVTLVVDNQDFKCNKTFLACHSNVFKAMLYGDFKETKEDRVEIKDVSVNSFRRVLEIIYTGKISDTSDFLVFAVKRNCTYHLFACNNNPPKELTQQIFACYNNPLNPPKELTHQIFACNNNPPKEFTEHSLKFWNETTELLNIADRFNLTSIVKNYIESVLTIAICSCSAEKCLACFNSFIFAILNRMDVSKCKKKYPLTLYQQWGNMADEGSYPDVYKKAVKILSQHLT